MRHVQITSPELQIYIRPQLTGPAVLVQHQGEGWQNVQRWWNISFSQWQGAPAYELQIPCIFNQWGYNPKTRKAKQSVEPQCRVMERMMEYIPAKRRTGILRVDAGGDIPHDYTNDHKKWWVASNIEWGDYIINKSGDRSRQEFTVTLFDWRPETIVNTTQHLPDRPVPQTYRVQKNDTLPKIATFFYGDQAMWHQIAKLNKVPHPLQLRVNSVLKLPRP